MKEMQAAVAAWIARSVAVGGKVDANDLNGIESIDCE